GQAAYLGAGAYAAALAADTGLSSGPAQLVIAAAAGAGAAAVTAPLVLRTRGTAFLMLTFAVGELARTAASKMPTVTGGDEGLPTPPVTVGPAPPPLRAAGSTSPSLLACFAILAAVTGLLLRPRLALILRGMADHEPRLTALGHHLPRSLSLGWITAGALAGAA